MALLPITITRLDADRFVVGRVTITRTDDGWAALAPGLDRPMFTAATLEEALESAAGFYTLFEPVGGYRSDDEDRY